jgi:hypothetical protein
MRDPLFTWAFIGLTVLGLLQAALEWLFWRRLASVESTAVRHELGSDVANRRSLGPVAVWRFLIRRGYGQLGDRSTVLVGDLFRIASLAFALTFLGVSGALALRFIRLFLHAQSAS